MLGELGQVWPSTWVEIWVPMLQHPEFGDDLARDLFREHVAEPKSTKPAADLAEGELSALNAAIRVYEERAASAKKARAALKRIWFKRPLKEITAIRFLEKSYSIFEEYGDGNFTNDYFNRVDQFLKRYSLRYDLRRPLTLHPTLAGIFASLIKELRSLSLQDEHLSTLLGEFEHAVRDLKPDLSQARIKTCLHKQFNLLEAIGRTFPGVTRQSLGDMCGEINSWPHVTIREALKKLYGFRSDYPGLGHAGNPDGVLRELDARDIVAIGVVLAGFVPYLSGERMNSRMVYGG
jgi:hypothetical protein